MKTSNVIEINGHIYDANTGLPIEGKGKKLGTIVKKASAKFVDGFAPRPKNSPLPTKPKTQSAKSSKPVAVSKTTPAKSIPTTRATGSNVKLKTKRSTTFNRSAVKAPNLSKEKASSVMAVQKKGLPSKRLERAQQIHKSGSISRFQKLSGNPPAAIAVTTGANKLKAMTAPTATTKTTTAASTQPNVKEQLIQKALHQAPTSTVQKAKKHNTKRSPERKHHIAWYITGAVLIVLAAGYVAYLNVPSISMKVAARRAGFAATLPEYKPSGYGLNGPIAYSPGQVTVNYKSTTDDRRFALTQQPTTWDSTALLENYVTKQTANYLTYQDSGLTIYMYNGSSAAWVNNGKLYKVDGKSSQLDADQLLKLATSV